MTRKALAALVASALLAAGIGGYLLGHRAEPLDAARPAVATPAPGPNPNALPRDPKPGPHVAQAGGGTPAAAPTPARPQPFGYQRLSVDAARLNPEACLMFNEALDDSGRVRYGDFLKIEPDAKPAIRIQQERLCLGGLSHGVDYRVELRAGFPAKGGAKLEAPEIVDVALGERLPHVSFAGGSGYILPRQGSAGLPVSTVNVAKVRIEVFRIGERLLPRLARGRYFDDDSEDAKKMGWWQIGEFMRDTGARVWTGTMDVQNRRNAPVTTAFPIRETIKDWKPGAYLVLAWDASKGSLDDIARQDSDVRYDFEAAAQWIYDTDIGLTSFAGNDGLSVFARSLHTAKPMAGVEVALVARNNEELARATTDAAGRVVFAAGLMRGTGGMEPRTLFAFDRERSDFNQLQLSKPAFDFSDRGVEGRPSPSLVDAFLYSDRGIYRPGETAHVVALVRDAQGNALERPPLTLVVRRPDGLEFRRVAMVAAAAGGAHYALELTSNARRGKWSLEAFVDPKGPPVGRLEFQVDDFVPEKLKVELGETPKVLRLDQPFSIGVSADFLYGAPAAGLEGEAELRVAVDSTPFPGLAGFTFGRADEAFESERIELRVNPTDARGKTQIAGAAKLPKETSLPLRATVAVAILEPGGRASRAETTVPLRTRDAYIGIKPMFTGAYAAEDRDVAFEIVAVDPEGRRIAKPRLRYELVRETYRFQWVQEGNSWRWQHSSVDRPVAQGETAVGTDRPATLARPLTWGSYRLAVIDEATGAATSVKFYVGWWAQAAAETPDQAIVVADKTSYAHGDVARVRIQAPFAGEALVVIASDRIFETRAVAVAAGGTTIEIPVSRDWGAGAYALVTAYRPLADRAGRAPVRAVGLAWLGVDPAQRTLAVTVEAPDRTLPRRVVQVPVRVANAGSAEVYVTLAAIDEGVLQLTRFRSPAPAAHYFGKRRLGVAMRDDYGKLLDPSADALGRIREGGDGLGGAGLEVVPIKTAALFSGIVKLDADGAATIPLEIPDFVGQLRLMAVAFDKTRVGQAEKRLIVRDAVATDLVLPRFLAPGDDSTASVTLHNVDGAAGAYRVRLAGSGPVSPSAAADRTVDLPLDRRELLTFPVRAGEAGIATLTLTVEGPGGFAVTRDWSIQVRPAQAPTTVQSVTPLDPGRELQVTRDLLANFVPGTANVTAAVSTLRGLDLPALLQSLDRYPFGCLEQTTSRALPLLYFSDAAMLGGAKDDRGVPARVQDAIYRVLDMQAGDGGFGMWSPYASSADLWLQAYALDFLTRAKDRGYAVPESQLRRSLQWLARGANQGGEEWWPDAQAYALYILARAGLADAGRVRYFQDTRAAKMIWPVGHAHLAAALHLVGEAGRAQLAWGEARRALAQPARTANYYGSALRDAMGVVAVAAESGERRLALEIANERVPRLEWRVDRLTTQEKSWTLIAASALLQSGQLSLQVDGRAVTAPREPAVFNPDAAALARGFVLRNTGTQPVYAAVSTRGVPAAPLPAQANGLRVSRSFHRLDGTPANMAQIRRNDRFVALIQGGKQLPGDASYQELAILDLLPAGFEIEAIVPLDNPYKWLPKLSELRTAEARDDRLFASVTLGEVYDPWGRFANRARSGSYPTEFTVAYVVRAVTPGTYVLPATQVEDMYRPEALARTAVGRLTIQPR